MTADWRDDDSGLTDREVLKILNNDEGGQSHDSDEILGEDESGGVDEDKSMVMDEEDDEDEEEGKVGEGKVFIEQLGRWVEEEHVVGSGKGLMVPVDA